MAAVDPPRAPPHAVVSDADVCTEVCYLVNRVHRVPQQKIATRVGCSQSTISNWVNNKTTPRLVNQQRVRQAYPQEWAHTRQQLIQALAVALAATPAPIVVPPVLVVVPPAPVATLAAPAPVPAPAPVAAPAAVPPPVTAKPAPVPAPAPPSTVVTTQRLVNDVKENDESKDEKKLLVSKEVVGKEQKFEQDKKVARSGSVWSEPLWPNPTLSPSPSPLAGVDIDIDIDIDIDVGGPGGPCGPLLSSPPVKIVPFPCDVSIFNPTLFPSSEIHWDEKHQEYQMPITIKVPSSPSPSLSRSDSISSASLSSISSLSSTSSSFSSGSNSSSGSFSFEFPESPGPYSFVHLDGIPSREPQPTKAARLSLSSQQTEMFHMLQYPHFYNESFVAELFAHLVVVAIQFIQSYGPS